MDDDEIRDHVSTGIQQIEDFTRNGHFDTALSAFELTAIGLAADADCPQMVRLFQPAAAFEVGETFFDEHPFLEAGAAEPSRFGPH